MRPEDVPPVEPALVVAADPAPPTPRGGPVHFPTKHKLERALFALTWFLLASWTPPGMRAWRALVLRAFGARLSPGSEVRASTKIWYPRNLVMEANSSLAPEVRCYNMALVIVRAGAIVSQRVHLCAGTHDSADPAFPLEAYPIEIGRDAWVASEAFIGPGVVVGDRAIVGARAVVTRDVPVDTVVVGNPARPLAGRRGRASTGGHGPRGARGAKPSV